MAIYSSFYYFFSPFENGSTGQHQQWQDMKHWPYGKKKPVMKHNESLGRTTEIAKIASLTLFIFVNWLKKSKDLDFFFTMLCSVRDLDAKHRRASIHWARSRAAFLKVLTTCFNDEIIKKKESIHTVRLRKKTNKKTYIRSVWRENETEKQCRRFTADLPRWNRSILCGEKESREALRAPEVPEPQRAALQATKGISAGGYITQPYVSGAGVTSSSSSSRALNHRWCSERSKEFEGVGSPRNAGTFLFNQKKKSVALPWKRGFVCWRFPVAPWRYLSSGVEAAVCFQLAGRLYRQFDPENHIQVGTGGNRPQTATVLGLNSLALAFGIPKIFEYLNEAVSPAKETDNSIIFTNYFCAPTAGLRLLPWQGSQ